MLANFWKIWRKDDLFQSRWKADNCLEKKNPLIKKVICFSRKPCFFLLRKKRNVLTSIENFVWRKTESGIQTPHHCLPYPDDTSHVCVLQVTNDSADSLRVMSKIRHWKKTTTTEMNNEHFPLELFFHGEYQESQRHYSVFSYKS